MVRAYYRNKPLLIEAGGGYSGAVDESELLKRIIVNPAIFGGEADYSRVSFGSRACAGDPGGR